MEFGTGRAIIACICVNVVAATTAATAATVTAVDVVDVTALCEALATSRCNRMQNMVNNPR